MSNATLQYTTFSLLYRTPNLTQVVMKVAMKPEYEIQYAKNYSLVRERHKKSLNSILSLDEVRRAYFNPEKKKKVTENVKKHIRTSPSEIYLFLALLTIYEVDVQKRQATFEETEWAFFSQNIVFSPLANVKSLKELIFKHNQTNFNWTQEEDRILVNLLSQHNCNCSKRVQWISISKLFNKEASISQMRSAPQCKQRAPQCKQRWEHTLKTRFKIGQWEIEEDLIILKFVLENGPKWAILTKMFIVNRNQHAVKNRFFSLISSYTDIPIRKLKKEIEYLNKFLISQAFTYHQKLWEEKKQMKEQKELSVSESLNNEEFLLYFNT